MGVTLLGAYAREETHGRQKLQSAVRSPNPDLCAREDVKSLSELTPVVN